MENINEMRGWPFRGFPEMMLSDRARRNHGFTMWTPQSSEGADEERGREGGRHGRRGGPHRREGFGPGVGPFGPRGGGPGGFGPGGGLGRGRGRGGRGRRGDVRAAVLLLLDESPMHGYELIQQIVAKSEGSWKPSPGSIYPALSQLEDEGLVLIDKVEGRKTARLTDEGKKYVDEHRVDLGAPWDDVKNSVGGDALDLRGLIGLLMGAAGQVAAVGTPAQVKEASEVLSDARRRLYRILAEDERTDPDA